MFSIIKLHFLVENDMTVNLVFDQVKRIEMILYVEGTVAVPFTTGLEYHQVSVPLDLSFFCFFCP